MRTVVYLLSLTSVFSMIFVYTNYVNNVEVKHAQMQVQIERVVAQVLLDNYNN
jgi:hypothetical protein